MEAKASKFCIASYAIRPLHIISSQSLRSNWHTVQEGASIRTKLSLQFLISTFLCCLEETTDVADDEPEKRGQFHIYLFLNLLIIVFRS